MSAPNTACSRPAQAKLLIDNRPVILDMPIPITMYNRERSEHANH